MGDEPSVRLGSERFWCPETINEVLGVCAEVLVVLGYSNTFLYSVPDGEPLAVWPHRSWRSADAIAREGDALLIDQGRLRRRVSLATGALLSEQTAPPPARVEIVGTARTRLRFEGPSGDGWTRRTPWLDWACAARDGERYAMTTSEGLQVRDAASGEVVYQCARFAIPTLSADGRWLAASLLGPPRCCVVEVDRGVEHGALLPPSLGNVLLGEGDLAVLDDASWELSTQRRLATLEDAGSVRAMLPGGRAVGSSVVRRGSTSGFLCVWDLATGARLSALPFPARTVECFSVDARGRYAACTLDSSRGLLLDLLDGVWLADLEAGSLRLLVDAPGGAPVALSPSGAVLAVGYPEEVRCFDLEGRLQRAVPTVEAAKGLRFLAEDTLLAFCIDEEGLAPDSLWDLSGGGPARLVARGAWVGARGLEVLRRAGSRLERVDLSGAVRGALEVGRPRRLWCSESLLATSENDGVLQVRPQRWSAPDA